MGTKSLTAEMQDRAVSIADRRCRHEIETFGILVPDRHASFVLTDEMGLPVRSLSLATEMMRESYRWLSDRGLASMRLSTEGIVVDLVGNPAHNVSEAV